MYVLHTAIPMIEVMRLAMRIVAWITIAVMIMTTTTIQIMIVTVVVIAIGKSNSKL